ncbi:c-type cytochrome [Psychrobacter sanguinis]|uniref:Cytochrome c5 family protein n=1 Tax=Psychrobacter sanguinis TaxID=861445 RepID=A0A844LYY4_9GAMM|nr:c-type cytochrome [Psychrobacter sanguinis]MUG31467.1 cytochrome c5 family protein [Psychrobacter sanguinis]
MLTINNQNNTQSKVAPKLYSAKSGWLLISALTLGLAVGCSGGNDTEAQNQAEPSASESIPADPAATQSEAPEAEASETIESSESTEQAPAADSEGSEAKPAEETTAAAPAPAQSAPLAADAGQKLYEVKCKQCHEPGLLNAPKFGNNADWAPRIAQGKEVLYKHSAEGFKAMPAQADGTASVEEVHAAVDYMVEHAS